MLSLPRISGELNKSPFRIPATHIISYHVQFLTAEGALSTPGPDFFRPAGPAMHQCSSTGGAHWVAEGMIRNVAQIDEFQPFLLAQTDGLLQCGHRRLAQIRKLEIGEETGQVPRSLLAQAVSHPRGHLLDARGIVVHAGHYVAGHLHMTSVFILRSDCRL